MRGTGKWNQMEDMNETGIERQRERDRVLKNDICVSESIYCLTVNV